ncbi:hypothetical protein EHQ92_12755 [Leptospira biflexa]|nr:hypothetical protein EHQ92_12755 [Leptospira biflexa]
MEKFLEEDKSILSKKKWIDTLYDINYPDSIKTRKLNYLAFEHGYSPYISHRALFDVFTLIRIVSKYNFEEILYNSNFPLCKFYIDIPFEQKDFYKDKGYFWNPELKLWSILGRENKILGFGKEFDKKEVIWDTHR